MKNNRFLVLAGMILVMVVMRWLPHPPNFTSVTSLALFGGAAFANNRLAFGLPLLVMFLSDLLIGFSGMTPIVYGTFALIAAMGFWLRSGKTIMRIAAASIASAGLFFLLTNFGVWAIDLGHLYPRTLAGLVECYVAGIPFFGNTLASSLLYSALAFGGLALIEKVFPGVREPVATAA